MRHLKAPRIKHWYGMAFVVATGIALCACGGGKGAQESPSPEVSATGSASSAATVSALPVSFTDVANDFGKQQIEDDGALGLFESASGAFKPDDSISRAQFVVWLVKAKNVYSAGNPAQLIRLAHRGQQFADVSPQDASFPYIQGLADAGYVIGIDKTHFAPNRPITREEMIAIKAPVDEGGNIAAVSSNLRDFIPFSDVNAITRRYLLPVYEDQSVRTTQNVARIWGKPKTFFPKKPVTKSEAAIAIWEVGGNSAPVTLGRTPPPAPK